MNKRRRLYFPVVLYLFLLLSVWLLSWFMGVVALLCDGETGLFSLVSAEGVRWALRSAWASVDSAPWAAILFSLSSLGLLVGSGMVRSASGVLRGGSLNFVERRAWLMALFALALFLLILFACTLYPWNILLGVTGEFSTSIVVQNGSMLLFAAVLFVTVVFGFVYGNYRSVVDVLHSLSAVFSFFAPALIAVLPASGILPCVEYAGFLSLLGVTEQGAALLSDALYAFPFLFMLLLMICDKGGFSKVV